LKITTPDHTKLSGVVILNFLLNFKWRRAKIKKSKFIAREYEKEKMWI